MFGINGWELILIGMIAVFVLGPDRLPEYAAKLAQLIRKARVMAEGAKGQLREQLGPEYDDINWRQYDPRQYDPRKIVREALLEPLEEAAAPLKSDWATNDVPTEDVTLPPMDEHPYADGLAADLGAGSAGDGAMAAYAGGGQVWSPDRPTPYDADAT